MSLVLNYAVTELIWTGTIYSRNPRGPNGPVKHAVEQDSGPNAPPLSLFDKHEWRDIAR